MQIATNTTVTHARRGGPLACALAALACVALLLGGCAFGEFRPGDPLDRGISLEEAQHRYTVLVRWSDFERAAKFVHEDVRDQFIDGAPSFKKLRFTEYESATPDIDEETGTATVEVTYSAYTVNSPIEIEVNEVQEWTRDGVRNNWRVRPSFKDLDAAMASVR